MLWKWTKLAKQRLFVLRLHHPKQSENCVKVLVTQSWTTLCNLLDCSQPGSSVHGILEAKILDWAAIPFSRGSSGPRDQTQVSRTAGRFSTLWAPRKPKGTIAALITDLNRFSRIKRRDILRISKAMELVRKELGPTGDNWWIENIWEEKACKKKRRRGNESDETPQKSFWDTIYKD